MSREIKSEKLRKGDTETEKEVTEDQMPQFSGFLGSGLKPESFRWPRFRWTAARRRRWRRTARTRSWTCRKRGLRQLGRLPSGLVEKFSLNDVSQGLNELLWQWPPFYCNRLIGQAANLSKILDSTKALNRREIGICQHLWDAPPTNWYFCLLLTKIWPFNE